MDILTNKASKQYDWTSRYAAFDTYYNTEDNKFLYGLTSQLDNTTTFILHKVEPADTLDKLAKKFYGRPDLFWVIADFNHIIDPFIELYGKYETLKIPAIASIAWRS